jgi:murein DD-endopeptidase MepM/ murein hydrolase activator NlpD
LRAPHGRGLQVLVLACIVSLLPVAALAQTAPTGRALDEVASERDRVEARVGQLRAEEGDARARLAQVEETLAVAEADLAREVAALEEAEAALEAADAAAAAARTRLAEVRAALQATEAELTLAIGKLESRVVAAFKYGQVSFTEAFSGVRDFSDFMTSTTMVAHVLDGDRMMVGEVQALFASVESQRAEAQALRETAEREREAAASAAARIEVAAREQERLLERIAAQRDEREQLFLELREDRAAAEGHLAGLEAESARIADQLAEIARQQAAAAAAEQARLEQEAAAAAAAAAEQARLEREAAERAAATTPDGPGSDDPTPTDPAPGDDSGEGGSGEAEPPPPPPPPPTTTPPPVATGWVRPVPGIVTSPFGPRWGAMHNGVDLRGDVGTTVVSAQPGTVVTAINSCHPTSSWGCGGGFGNYVTVVHANGLATIYAHLSATAVGIGQQVSAGQAVGLVGNSGNSYGPHLHFEVRLAGVPQNPCGYIPC